MGPRALRQIFGLSAYQSEGWAQPFSGLRPRGPRNGAANSPEGYLQLQRELVALKAQRPRLAAELHRPHRENSPIDDTQLARDWVRHVKRSLLEERVSETWSLC